MGLHHPLNSKLLPSALTLFTIFLSTTRDFRRFLKDIRKACEKMDR